MTFLATYLSQSVYLLPLIFAAALGLLVGCGGGGGSSDRTAELHTVEVYGDSIVRSPGLAVPMAQALRSMLPGWSIDDRSASGLRLAELMTGYAEPFKGAARELYPAGPQPAFAAVSRQAHVVVIALGANDAPGTRPVDAFERDLREAVRIVRAEGRTAVLTGIVGLPVSDAFPAPWVARSAELNAITLAVAAELGLQHAGWGEAYEGPKDVIDSVHRTQDASDRLAARLASAIERATHS